MMTLVSRFAPSPTGDLHLGHAYSARYAWDVAIGAGGRFLVRIEDIDTGRCRAEFIERNLDDLRWLGLTWEEPVARQSERMDLYRDALHRLDELGVTYPCFCTRREIRAEIEAAAGAPHAIAPDGGILYPGTCRARDAVERDALIAAGRPYAIRLNIARVRELTGRLSWTDQRLGPQAAAIGRFGDVVIARKEVAASYHLAVVVDDAAQGVTEVTRGKDLFDATHVHRTLYALLDLPPPIWHHHDLCHDETGNRLSKRRGDETIRSLRERGHKADNVLAMARAAAARPGQAPDPRERKP
jgi:glutamyl-Q tRNA(Asp) synthetase